MNASTIAARESVQVIRGSLSGERVEPTMYALKTELERARWKLNNEELDQDYEAIELWARLAADIAGMIQQREK